MLPYVVFAAAIQYVHIVLLAGFPEIAVKILEQIIHRQPIG
jgi:hypothetical protein